VWDWIPSAAQVSGREDNVVYWIREDATASAWDTVLATSVAGAQSRRHRVRAGSTAGAGCSPDCVREARLQQQSLVDAHFMGHALVFRPRASLSSAGRTHTHNARAATAAVPRRLNSSKPMVMVG
jgi:hypothetical protein